MPKGYHHLTYEKRCQLQVLKESGNSIIEIAQALGIHRSVIYQELGRNSGMVQKERGKGNISSFCESVSSW